MLVTFDLFSALIDARTGGSAAFEQIATTHGWSVPGELLYDRWDAANKASQRDLAEWVPFSEHSRRPRLPRIAGAPPAAASRG